MVNGGQERYENIRLLLERLQLQRISGLVLVGDLSIVNVYIGISSHVRKYASYICEGESILEAGTTQTFRNLASQHEGYVVRGPDPKTMKLFKNVIHP